MSFFAASAFLKALGWALFNSLWQFAICWILYRICTSAGKNLAAAARHTIALCLLLVGNIFFIIGLSWKFYANPAVNSGTGNALVIENTSWYNSWHATSKYIDTVMPYWSLLYLACVIFLFIKLVFFVRRAGKLQHNGISGMHTTWRTYISNISLQLGIHREVNAFLSVHIDTPQVIGFLKPVILLPAACLVNLSTEQLEAVLLHELVHIKRNDYLVNLFIASVEILFFFNPFVKQITASIRKEREYSCDDMVIGFNYHPGHYASALLTLEKSRLLPVTYGIAASGKNQKQLLTRIERIVGVNNKQPAFYRAGTGLLALLLLAAVATIHPAKTDFSAFSPARTVFSDNIAPGLSYNGEAKTRLAGIHARAGNIIKKAGHPLPAKNNVPVESGENFTNTVFAEDNAGADNDMHHAAITETIDFSLPEKDPIDVPEAALPPAATAEPYVPASSFSYQFSQDTAVPKVKGETYNERRAREAMIKTKKAMAAINWQKIEKDLKYNSRGLSKLKKEISVQLQHLNWQQINAEVQNQLGGEEMGKLQTALKQEQVLKQYQYNEAYTEALQKQLSVQEQLIKASDQRMRENQKTVEQRQLKLQQEMKKHRIIYI